jgi:hypothetical protein
VSAYDGPRLALSTRGHLVEMRANDKQREERLAAALRANLKRRKAQARAVDKVAPDEPDQP